MNQQPDKGLFTFYKQQQQQDLHNNRQPTTKKRNNKSKSNSKGKHKNKQRAQMKSIEKSKYETIEEINQEAREDYQEGHHVFLKNIKTKHKDDYIGEKRKALRIKTQPSQSLPPTRLHTLPQNHLSPAQHRAHKIHSDQTSQTPSKYKHLSQLLQKCREDFYPNGDKPAIFRKYEANNPSFFIDKEKGYQFNVKSNLLKLEEGMNIKKELLSRVLQNNKSYVSHAINSIFGQQEKGKDINDLVLKSPLKLPPLLKNLHNRPNQKSSKELPEMSQDKHRKISLKKSRKNIKELFKQKERQEMDYDETNKMRIHLINMSDSCQTNSKHPYDSLQWKSKRKIIREIFGKEL